MKGNKPQTLKFTQNSSVCVLHTHSFNIAKKKKKKIHLMLNFSQPSFSNLIELPKNFFNKGSLEKNFPKIKAKPNSKFIIVGFMYKKIGLLKYIVNPPKKVIKIPPIKGINAIFFSTKYARISANNVAIIKGGIANVRFLPPL